MYQKLLTKDIIKRMPLDVEDAESAPVIVKFFGGGSYRLYVITAHAHLESGEEVKLSDINGKPVEDIHYYGYVTGLHCDEWGSTSDNELRALKFPPFGLGIERDMHLGNITVKQVIAKEVY